MHITSRSTTWTRSLQAFCAGLLLVGVFLLGVGCDGGGSTGGGPEDTTPPSVPSGLSADAGEANVTLSWSSVSDADTYSVYRSTSSTGGVSGSPLNSGLSSTSYDDETAENGTTYYYRVTAVDTAGNESDGSSEVQSTPFVSPNDLTGRSEDSQISLSWSAATGAASYSVYRSTSSFEDVSGMDPLATEISSAAYTDTDAQNGTKYYYRITSVNPESEESGATNAIEKTPFAEPDRP